MDKKSKIVRLKKKNSLDRQTYEDLWKDPTPNYGSNGLLLKEKVRLPTIFIYIIKSPNTETHLTLLPVAS